MTLNDWNKRDDFKIAWKTFSRSEAGKALAEILTNLGTPIPTLPPAGVDFIDWNATLNSRREGYFEALRVLNSLSEDFVQKDELPEPWETKIETTNQ
jgi:hypothetical protein